MVVVVKNIMDLKALLDTPIDQLPDVDGATRHSGKVRESYSFENGTRAIVVTDRISAFDFILGTIPLKGQVLNRITTWWLKEVEKIGIPTHFIDQPHPNISINKNAKALPIECVVRGYLTGSTTTSSWYAYQHHDRMISGIEMPAGMKKNEQFPEAIFTPSTKPKDGTHDINISRSEILKQSLVSEKVLDRCEEIALKMFAHGQKLARERGLILVDTKYEMGLDENGDVIVIDEVHTPDSSRYWIEDTYTDRLSKSQEPDSLDKEFVRRMIVAAGYNVDDVSDNPKNYMSDDIRIQAAEKYLELLKIFTGEELDFSVNSLGDITEILNSLNEANS